MSDTLEFEQEKSLGASSFIYFSYSHPAPHTRVGTVSAQHQK